MKKFQKMSEAEKKIMEIIWSVGRPITTKEIMGSLPDSNYWKQNTVVTFLARLMEKGILKATRISKANYYEACMSEQEYADFETKKFIETVHKGSIFSFISSLCNSGELNLKDIEDIKNLLK